MAVEKAFGYLKDFPHRQMKVNQKDLTGFLELMIPDIFLQEQHPNSFDKLNE